MITPHGIKFYFSQDLEPNQFTDRLVDALQAVTKLDLNVATVEGEVTLRLSSQVLYGVRPKDGEFVVHVLAVVDHNGSFKPTGPPPTRTPHQTTYSMKLK